MSRGAAVASPDGSIIARPDRGAQAERRASPAGREPGRRSVAERRACPGCATRPVAERRACPGWGNPAGGRWRECFSIRS